MTAVQPLAHLARCLPLPTLTGVFKQSPEDFRVDEVLGFEPDGEGNHGLFLIEKVGLTTPQMLGKIARLAKVAERDIGFCGLKDKQAVTRQWISVPLGLSDPDWFEALPDEVQVVRWGRHRKKLRRGIHQGNHFTITIRAVQGNDDAFEQRLAQLRAQGFANYFAEQRFGADARNLDLLFKLGVMPAASSGSVSRSDRNWGISTLRAVIFNAVLSERISMGTVAVTQVGDLAQLAGSHSRFLVTDEELARTQQRLVEQDIWLTGPLWGSKAPQTAGQVLDLEARIGAQVVAEYGPEAWVSHLAAWRVEQDRRSLLAPLRDLAAVFQNDEVGSTTLTLSFTLNSGSYATALMRELISIDSTSS